MVKKIFELRDYLVYLKGALGGSGGGGGGAGGSPGRRRPDFSLWPPRNLLLCGLFKCKSFPLIG